MKFFRPHALLGVTVGVATLGLMLLAPAGAAAAEAAPAWEITQATSPTNLVPGSDAASHTFEEPSLKLYLTNVGDEVAGDAGTPILTDTLPEGVTVAPGSEAKIEMPAGPVRTTRPCAVSGLTVQTVTCEVTQPTSPGELVQILIPLHVQVAEGPVTNHVSVSGGGAPAASDSAVAMVSSTLPSFGFVSPAGLWARAFDAAGSPPSIAGSHPFMVEIGAEFNSFTGALGFATPRQALRNLNLDLPAGVVANPAAVPVRCTTAQIASGGAEQGGCPVEAQVGVVYLEISGSGRGPSALYVMVPSPGHPAELAFSYDGVIAHIIGGLGSDFHLTAEASELLAKFPILGVDTFLWGVPSDPGHDSQRYGESKSAKGCRTHFGCPMEAVSPAPFLTMPSSCTEPMDLQADATSWLGAEDKETRPLAGLDGEPIHPTGCSSLVFEPSVEAGVTTGVGDSPSGLDFAIHQPQDESLEGRATATLKNATVTLPEGMVLNPAAANGLGSCTEGEMGYAPEEGKIRFDKTPQGCPDAAKIGTLEVHTPLLEKSLPGSVYVAKPYDNPFGSLLAIYLVIEDEETGIVAKLAGKVTPDPVTGRLTTTFTENPELPLEDIDLHFFKDGEGVLTTPLTCGESTIDSTLTPWSTPEGVDAHPSSSVKITSGCSGSESAAPKTVSFSAGTVTPTSGAFSPFVLNVSRPDGSQHLTGVETALPEGLLGSVAGVSYCSEAGIAQARSREEPEEGRAEQQDPSCPSSSELGTVSTTVGSGGTPFGVSGHVYLAGPYKGAPLSLVVIVPGVAGPFDLGTVVDRVALFINEQTARINALADPLPTIRDGIPLDVKSIELDMNRSGFIFNPTSCEPMTIEGRLTTQPGQTVPLNDRFQVGGCQNLPFKPLMSISTQGKTSKANGASLTVKVSQQPGEAHIHKVDLTLPTTLPARLSTLQQACTEAQFNTNPAACPPGSFIGTAKATTPILNVPLTGPAILVSHGGAAFPDVEFLLQANERGSDIRITLDGKTDIKKGTTYSRFETVPDAPINSFETSLPQGPHSVLSANANLCTSKPTIPTEMVGQNGALVSQSTKVTVTGCPKAKALTRAQKLAIALKACKKKAKGKKRTSCERAARKKYGPLKKAKKTKRK